MNENYIKDCAKYGTRWAKMVDSTENNQTPTTQTQTPTRIPTLEEIVNRMWEKYLKVTNKEKKLEAVKKMLIMLGIEEKDINVCWNSKKEIADASAYLPYSVANKIKEIYNNRTIDEIEPLDVYILATTGRIRGEKWMDEVLGICYTVDSFDYIHIGKYNIDGIEVNLYLEVSYVEHR